MRQAHICSNISTILWTGIHRVRRLFRRLGQRTNRFSFLHLQMIAKIANCNDSHVRADAAELLPQNRNIHFHMVLYGIGLQSPDMHQNRILGQVLFGGFAFRPYFFILITWCIVKKSPHSVLEWGDLIYLSLHQK